MINRFKVVGGLKYYLIAGLILDLEISRKNEQCQLLSKDFSSHMIFIASSTSRKCWHPLCSVHLEKELQSGKVVLAWESFS